jgi:hypothetical protein
VEQDQLPVRRDHRAGREPVVHRAVFGRGRAADPRRARQPVPRRHQLHPQRHSVRRRRYSGSSRERSRLRPGGRTRGSRQRRRRGCRRPGRGTGLARRSARQPS